MIYYWFAKGSKNSKNVVLLFFTFSKFIACCTQIGIVLLIMVERVTEMRFSGSTYLELISQGRKVEFSLFDCLLLYNILQNFAL